MISDAGPPVAKAEPEPTKRPVPERYVRFMPADIWMATHQLNLQLQSSEDGVV